MWKMEDGSVNIPSLAAIKGLLVFYIHLVAKCTFAPISPYSMAEFDSIFTTTINFQMFTKKTA